jgi:hypothetical protein
MNGFFKGFGKQVGKDHEEHVPNTPWSLFGNPPN